MSSNNRPILVLTNQIKFETKPTKSRSKMFDLIESYPAVLDFEYSIKYNYGRIGDVKVINKQNGRSCVLKPSIIDSVLWYLDDAGDKYEILN